jgi:Ca2+-dependent lipid-binding protein
MDTGEEQRRSFNVRLGHQTTSWPILVNGDNAQNAASQGSSPSQLSHGQQQVIRAFLQQKPHRVHQNVLFRKAMYIILTIISMLSAWAIGYYGFSIVFLIALVVCMYIFWKDQSHKIAFDTEQEIEMKIRRKKAMQMSETAEWVNHAINRW